MTTDRLPDNIIELLMRFNDALPSTRGLAAQMLVKDTAYAAAIVPVLKSVMASDPSPYVRASAAYAITRLTPTDRTGIATLAQLLHDEDERGRWTSAQLLSELGSAVVQVLPAMVSALKDSNAGVRFHAAGYLAQLAPASAIAIQDLIGLLQDEDNDVQEQAATAIGNLALAGYRTQLTPAVPLLLALITDAGTANRPLFMHVVFDISPSDSIVQETLARLLHDPDYEVKHNAELLLRTPRGSPADFHDDDCSGL